METIVLSKREDYGSSGEGAQEGGGAATDREDDKSLRPGGRR